MWRVWKWNAKKRRSWMMITVTNDSKMVSKNVSMGRVGVLWYRACASGNLGGGLASLYELEETRPIWLNIMSTVEKSLHPGPKMMGGKCNMM